MRWYKASLFIAGAVGLLCLSACASFLLSGGLPLLEIAPTTLGTRIVEQRLSLQWQEKQKSFEAVLDIRNDTLTVIGLALGARLFSADYDGKKIIETQPLPNNLPAQRIINDLLLIYAPYDTLQAALPEDWKVHDEFHERQVHHGDSLAIVIRYETVSLWQGRVVLDNRALHYTLTIDSRELAS